MKMKPKGKLGMVAVKRLGRTYKTGEFDRIVKATGKKYGKEAGKKIAASIYWKKVNNRK